MGRTLTVLVTLYLATTSSLLLAANAGNGKMLQQKNCMSCHDDGMYTRENRLIKEMPSLRTQVQRCESTLGLKWFDEDVDEVTAYLNNSFYHFK